MIFELMISIYLFTKKNQFIFLISLVFNFQKNYFYLLLLEKNEFLQFYLWKYFNLFSFKKSDLYKLLNIYITLLAKKFLIKRKKILNPLFLKNYF